jgi:hypothetical protein
MHIRASAICVDFDMMQVWYWPQAETLEQKLPKHSQVQPTVGYTGYINVT